jgi:hypothetical protein
MSAAIKRRPTATKSRVANEYQQLAHLARPGATVSPLMLAEQLCDMEATTLAVHAQADALIEAILRLLPEHNNSHPALRLDAASTGADKAALARDIKRARVLLCTLRAQLTQVADDASEARAVCGLRPAPGASDV